MSTNISSKSFSAIALHPTDNTATLLTDGRMGDVISVALANTTTSIRLVADIPFGHKTALVPIQKGHAIIKYGEIIGRATSDITPGEWVHTHNVESLRGRGDELDIQASARLNCEEMTQHNCLALEKPIQDLQNSTFHGWVRANGTVGIRNLVGVISTVACANDVASAIAKDIAGSALFTHQQGCSQTRPDVELVERVLTNIAANPNLGAVVFVSLGCESVDTEKVVQAAKLLGKPVETIVIQNIGGKSASIKKGREVVQKLARLLSKESKSVVPISRLRIGLKCGSSDTTQGLSSNIVIGKLTDIFVAAKAQVIIGETTEFMGAEHIAARHSANQSVGSAIIKAVSNMEARALSMGVDMRGGQPTRGNIAGGLTTIEEKSLGALAKAGSAIFQDVVAYGTPSEKPGLIMMDSPGREPELLTGLAAMGCNLVLFATGRGAPQGFPFMPVIKITGNKKTWQLMNEHMDCCVASVIDGELHTEDAAKEVLEKIFAVISGEPTKAELCGYVNSMNIYTTGPTI